MSMAAPPAHGWFPRPSPTRSNMGLGNGPFVVGVKSGGDVWSSTGAPRWVEEVVERIDRLGDLEDDWDGAGATPASAEAVRTALVVLAETMAPDSVAPHFVPTPDGGLQLEWHCVGVDLEIYVEADGRVSAWCREGSRAWEEDVYPRVRLAKELSLLTYGLCE
jgi:hypothetical protein